MNIVFGVDWENHKNMAIYANELPEEVLKSYYKFSIVRNPWARLFSDYNFQKRKSRGEKLFLFDKEGKKRNFPDWVEAVFAEPYFYNASMWGGNVSDGIHRWSPQVDWLKLGQQIETDFVAKLERIDEDFSLICEALGMPRKKIPKKNSRFHFHYSRYYDDRLISRVARYYEEDIDTFKYTFKG